MYSAVIIHFATDVLAQGQQQKPKKCIQFRDYGTLDSRWEPVVHVCAYV